MCRRRLRLRASVCIHACKRGCRARCAWARGGMHVGACVLAHVPVVALTRHGEAGDRSALQHECDGPGKDGVGHCRHAYRRFSVGVRRGHVCHWCVACVRPLLASLARVPGPAPAQPLLSPGACRHAAALYLLWLLPCCVSMRPFPPPPCFLSSPRATGVACVGQGASRAPRR